MIQDMIYIYHIIIIIIWYKIYISLECVICVRVREACGRLTCVNLVGHYFRILNVSFPKLRVFLKTHSFRPRKHLLRPAQGHAAKLNFVPWGQAQHIPSSIANVFTGSF